MVIFASLLVLSCFVGALSFSVRPFILQDAPYRALNRCASEEASMRSYSSRSSRGVGFHFSVLRAGKGFGKQQKAEPPASTPPPDAEGGATSDPALSSAAPELDSTMSTSERQDKILREKFGLVSSAPSKPKTDSVASRLERAKGGLNASFFCGRQSQARPRVI